MRIRYTTSLMIAIAFWGILSDQAIADPPRAVSPDGSVVLAEGPLQVTISFKDKGTGTTTKLEKGSLLFLTRNGLFFKDPKTNRAFARPAQSLAYAHVETLAPVILENGKMGTAYWTLDTQVDPPVFKGDRLPGLVPDLTSRPGNTPKELNWFLFYALSELQERIEDAITSDDKLQLDFFSTRAGNVASFMIANKLDKVVSAAYEGLPRYAEQQSGLIRKLEDEYVEQARNRQELFARARDAQARKAREQLAGGLTFLVGALNTDAYDVTYTNGWGDRWVQRENRSNPDVGTMASGFARMAQGQANYQAEMSRLAIAKQAFEAGSQKRLDAWYAEFSANRQARAQLLRTIAVERFQLDKARPLDRLPQVQQEAIKLKNRQPVIALFEEQVKYERGTGEFDNPFALCDVYEVRAQLIGSKGSERSDELFALALKALETVRLVPAGELFDFERLQLLRMAAQLACRAAAADAPQGYWSRSYSPRAAFAVRLLDLASLQTLDVTGEAREQRAIALLLVGRVPEALDQALAVSKLRATSGSYHYNMTRLYSAQVLVAEAKDRTKYGNLAMESLEAAMKYGFSNFKDLKADGLDSDFAYLRTAAVKARVNKLTQLSFIYAIIPPTNVGDPHVLRLKNTSAFTVTNPAATFQVWNAQNVVSKDVDLAQSIPTLRSGQESFVEIRDPGKILSKKGIKGKLTVTCDQGTFAR